MEWLANLLWFVAGWSFHAVIWPQLVKLNEPAPTEKEEVLETAESLFDKQPEWIQKVIRKFLCDETAVYAFVTSIPQHEPVRSGGYYGYEKYKSLQHLADGVIQATLESNRGEIQMTFDREIDDQMRIIKLIVGDLRAEQDRINREKDRKIQQQREEKRKRTERLRLREHVCTSRNKGTSVC